MEINILPVMGGVETGLKTSFAVSGLEILVSVLCS